MTDSLYQPKTYRRQGGDAFVLAAGGTLVVQTGAAIVPNSETQASHIANATGATASNCQSTINSILTDLEGVGILATS